MLINERDKLASILQTAAEALDIPDHAYEAAILKYEDICDHLAAEDSDLREYKPQLYPQGSFRLGTVVQPIGRGDEYDIDLICQLGIAKESITQKELKDKIGRRLKTREDLATIIEPSRRCWTLDYPVESGMPGFHMDVLPSIPNEKRLPTGILLTDTELTRWQESNPIGYADWFRNRMEVRFLARKAYLAKSKQVGIEEVPDWWVKTSLQRSVQILKRHRDIHFQKKLDVKPVSIILTTLAAHAYANEEDIFEALTSIAKRMPSFIKYQNGEWRVQNPVSDGENFADKWNEYPERREAFLAWLKKVEDDFAALSKAATLNDGVAMLEKLLGSQTMNMVATKFGLQRTGLSPAIISSLAQVPALGDAHHAQPPQWQIEPKYKVKVSADVYFKQGSRKGSRLWSAADRHVPKNVWLRFIAQSDTPEPYSVKWQVVNTGQEANQAGQPRGEFYESDESDKRVRWESTLYRGTHWVEAFILKDEVCVARSGKFLVKVR